MLCSAPAAGREQPGLVGHVSPSQPGFADTIKLAFGVQSTDQLSATGSQVSVEGHVNLQVIGTAANPVIIGRTNLTSGELFYRSVRYPASQLARPALLD
jgi:hypothetical protein